MHTTIEHRPLLHGHLEVHVTRDAAGNTVREVFTFSSLASVLNLPQATLEGRYTRSNAKTHKINLRTGAGRPARGFPIGLLDQIVDAMTRADSRFAPAAVAHHPQPDQNTLEYVAFNGEPHFTVQALATYYGVTAPTVRSRVKSAGLDTRMVPAGSGRQGGRPRLAFHKQDLADVHLAMTGNISFATEEATRVAHVVHDTTAVERELAAAITPEVEDNLILHGLRAAGKVGGANATPRSGGNDIDWDAVIAEISKMAPDKREEVGGEPVRSIPLYKLPEPEVCTHPSGYIQVKTADAWFEKVNTVARKHITQRHALDLEHLHASTVSMNGQGLDLGLSVTGQELEAYVVAMRDRVRVHTRPYEDMLRAKLDEHLPEDATEHDPYAAYALLRAMYLTPVYVGQVPAALVDSRVKKYGTAALWNELRGTARVSQEKRARTQDAVMESSVFVEKFRELSHELYMAVATIDCREGVHVSLHPDMNGHLWVPPIVIEPFRNA